MNTLSNARSKYLLSKYTEMNTALTLTSFHLYPLDNECSRSRFDNHAMDKCMREHRIFNVQLD